MIEQRGGTAATSLIPTSSQPDVDLRKLNWLKLNGGKRSSINEAEKVNDAVGVFNTTASVEAVVDLCNIEPPAQDQGQRLSTGPGHLVLCG